MQSASLPFRYIVYVLLALWLKPAIGFASTNTYTDFEQSIFESPFVKLDEITGTVIGQGFTDQALLKNSVYGLLELKKTLNDTELEIGLAFDSIDNQPKINTLSYTHYFDDYEIKIGKFVSKIGVLDFFSCIDVLNTTRIQYYDEENINLRQRPSLLGQFNYFLDENSTLNFIVAPYDDNRRDYVNQSIGLSLNIGVPYYLLNSGNSTIDLIAKPILLPVYNQGAKQAVSKYIDNKLPKNHIELDTTTFAMNYTTYQNQSTFGAVYINGYSNIPIIKLDPDLIAAVENLNDEDAVNYIDTYLQKDENEPIKSIQYNRYNQIAVYTETAIQSYGLRAELSYRDQFPIINDVTEQLSLGLGIDHKGEIYNNLELQYFYLPNKSIKAYYAIWQMRFDSFYIGKWKTQIENTSSLATYENNQLYGMLPSINFNYKNLNISLKYLMHSKQELVENTAILSVKAVF
ncbi:hypothetical protein [Thiomicrorhabdus sp.]|uniref:hypothetical protein n=1 Tax=Thiomicrorhabdus sp. TaxID=2039724 RepID=UPI002AA8FA30|nr:hypothetical protein [Thiomicrorhabdus sp.]